MFGRDEKVKIDRLTVARFDREPQLDICKDHGDPRQCTRGLATANLLIASKCMVVGDAYRMNRRGRGLECSNASIPVLVELTISERARGVDVRIPPQPARAGTPTATARWAHTVPFRVRSSAAAVTT